MNELTHYLHTNLNQSTPTQNQQQIMTNTHPPASPQVGVDMASFPGLKNDLDFVERLISEESVFCLPGKVSSRLLDGTEVRQRQTGKDRCKERLIEEDIVLAA